MWEYSVTLFYIYLYFSLIKLLNWKYIIVTIDDSKAHCLYSSTRIQDTFSLHPTSNSYSVVLKTYWLYKLFIVPTASHTSPAPSTVVMSSCLRVHVRERTVGWGGELYEVMLCPELGWMGGGMRKGAGSGGGLTYFLLLQLLLLASRGKWGGLRRVHSCDWRAAAPGSRW